MPTYIVIENTPGYLPDDDDPATFEDRRDAIRYMIELVRFNRDFRLEGGEDVGGWIDRDAGSAYLVDEGRPYDLGRYFEVIETSDWDEGSWGWMPEGHRPLPPIS
jgi:hypothetical protein